MKRAWIAFAGAAVLSWACSDPDVNFGGAGSTGNTGSTTGGGASGGAASTSSAAGSTSSAGGSTTSAGGSGGSSTSSGMAGAPPCDESPCKLEAPQCGCSTNQKCTIDGQGMRVCLPDGSKSEGELCNDDCMAGLICLPQDDQPALCKAFCDNDNDCTGPGGRCVLDVEDGNGQAVEHACTMNCDPLSGVGCSFSGTKCAIRRAGMTNTFVTDCIGAGSSGQSQGCTDANDCAPGLGCIFVGQGQTQCLTYCNVNNPSCPNNLTCTSFQTPITIGGTEYGVCI